MKADRLLPILFVTALAGSARADLISNGGFESGTFAGWMTQSAPSGSFFSVRNDSPAGTHSGDYSAYFSASGPYDEMLTRDAWRYFPRSAFESKRLPIAGTDTTVFYVPAYRGVSGLDVKIARARYTSQRVTRRLRAIANGSETRPPTLR